jgi:ferredoxin-like protein FixX
MENQFIHTLKSIWLCIKYPFLYPRNRWTGNHYDNWKFKNVIYGDKGLYDKEYKTEGLYQKAFIVNIDQETYVMTKTVKDWRYALLFYLCEFIYYYPIQWAHCIPTYTEWDAMDGMPGWKKAFGDQYLKELKAQLKKDHYLYQFRITDIKEKYGTLRLYCNGASDEVYKIIDKYENLSYETCIECGDPAVIITDGYVLPYCMHCWASHKPLRKISLHKIDGVHWVDADDIQIVPRDKKDE